MLARHDPGQTQFSYSVPSLSESYRRLGHSVSARYACGVISRGFDAVALPLTFFVLITLKF